MFHAYSSLLQMSQRLWSPIIVIKAISTAIAGQKHRAARKGYVAHSALIHHESVAAISLRLVGRIFT